MNKILTTLITVISTIHIKSHFSIGNSGINLIRQTATKIKSAIESNLEPKSFAVPVFLATVPSIISDTPAIRYRM